MAIGVGALLILLIALVVMRRRRLLASGLESSSKVAPEERPPPQALPLAGIAIGGLGDDADRWGYVRESTPRMTARHSLIKISTPSLDKKSSEPHSGLSRLSTLTDWYIPIEEIKIGDRIGAGSFGEVFYGTWNVTEVAVKIIFDVDSNSSALQEFYTEVQVMAKLRHPCIVP